MTIQELEAQLSADYGGPAIGAWPRRKGERIKPHKGGGGGDPGAEARQQEADRQARIKAATEEINRVFNQQQLDSAVGATKRDGLYQEQKSAVYDLNKREVDRQASDAERLNRFGLARTGLMGGSVNVDSVADLNRRTNEGLMRAGGIADQASADLKTADERTRSNLISLAQSGIDSGTAAQQALKGLEVNAANAASARAGSTVGGLFDDMSQAYLFNQQNQGRQAAQLPGSQWYGVSNPRTGDSGSVTR